VTADVVMRRGVGYGGPHTIFSVDANRFNSVRVLSVDPVTQIPTTVSTRVMPLCQGATTAATIALRNDPNALCSVGSIAVYQSAANFRYVGLHIKVDKRFTNRFQFTASYARARYTGWNGVVNLDNLQESYGIHPNDRPHRFNFSGIWEAPEYKGPNRFTRGLASGWQLSTINQLQSSPPANPTMAIDVDGEGTSIYRLPGIEWNGFGRSADPAGIRQAVERYNADVEARTTNCPTGRCRPRTPRNQVYPIIALPDVFSNGDTAMTTDIRLTREVRLRENIRLALIGEVFNVLNIANLGGYSDTLQTTPTFGIPTTRTNQVFGSGGPRAFQVAARLSF
ncbi:MAG: hypothetical protein ACRD96_28765, partial [Bryobacteraceae bacterium]